jgi:hypothetical protein
MSAFPNYKSYQDFLRWEFETNNNLSFEQKIFYSNTLEINKEKVTA